MAQADNSDSDGGMAAAPEVASDSPADRRNFMTSVAMAGGLLAGYGTFAVMAGRYLYPASTSTAWQFLAPAAEMKPGGSREYVSPTGLKIVVTRKAASAAGVLALKPGPGDSGWQRFDAYLWSEETFGDFVLDLEYKIPRQGNGGVFFRVDDKADPVNTGIELQIVDSHGKQDELTDHDCGGIIGTIAPSKNVANPSEQWNRLLISCRGNRLQVELNGEEIVDLALDESAMKNRPSRGFIGLQDHGLPLWFRNIRIKELADPESVDGGGEFAPMFNGEDLNGWQTEGNWLVVEENETPTADQFLALSSICPHLGCRVHWEPRNDRFFCPCHNGAFDAEGQPIAGPPKSDDQHLPQYPLMVAEGLLYIEVPVESVGENNNAFLAVAEPRGSCEDEPTESEA
jgi:Rieske Fe-S protein